jgi:ubiquinone/menaquinone biosynthesis C-methylase UbiE
MPTLAMTAEPQPDEARRPNAADIRFWDRVAGKYAASPIEDVAGYERSLARTRDFLTKDDHVLEIGCGTGTTALKQAPHLRHITGTDISPAMIAIAQAKLDEGGPLNVDFIAAGADDESLKGSPFDAVMAHNVLHLVPDLGATLAHLRHLLRPGGLLIAKTPCLGDMNPLIRWVMLPAMRAVGKAPHVATFDAKTLEKAISDAGFAIETVEFHGTKGRDARPFVVARRG